MAWDWSQAGQGAAGGAATGAALGSVLPGLGTGVGAVLGGLGGGLLGGFGSNPYEGALRDQLGRPAPQAGPASPAQNSFFRNNQSELIKRLEAQSRGEGPSLAAQQLQAAQDRGMKQGAGLAASTAGPNAALGQFQALNVAGANQAQASQDAAMARIQEQYNAQNLLGLTVHGARQQDESVGMFNSAQQNAMSQANLAAKLEAMGLDRNTLMALMGNAGPGMGTQLMAGGFGALGFLAGQQGLGGQGGNPMQALGGRVGQGPGQMTQTMGPGPGQSPFGAPRGPVDPWGPGSEWAQLQQYGLNQPWNLPGV